MKASVEKNASDILRGLLAATRDVDVGIFLGEEAGVDVSCEDFEDEDFQRMLFLKNTFQESERNGFLLRHYWIPATDLTVSRSVCFSMSDASNIRWNMLIFQSPLCFRSDSFFWSEQMTTTYFETECSDDRRPREIFLPFTKRRCLYNHFEQSLGSDFVKGYESGGW